MFFSFHDTTAKLYGIIHMRGGCHTSIVWQPPQTRRTCARSAIPYSISLCSKTWKPAFSMAQLASAALAGSAILSASTAMSSVVEKQ